MQGTLETFSILLNKIKEFSQKLKEFSEKLKEFSEKLKDFLWKTQGFANSTWFLLPKNVQKSLLLHEGCPNTFLVEKEHYSAGALNSNFECL